MKTSLKICFIALFLASCQSNTSSATAIVIPTETVQPTETILPLVQARQKELMSIWENSIHAQGSDPVNCDDCHRIENGVVLEDVSESNALCSQCHTEVSAGHVHMTFSCIDCHDPHKVEASCTDSGCHTNIPTVFFELPATPTGGHPNSGSSFCGGTNCHSVATAVVETTETVHGPKHAHVTCEACHDASQLQVGPSPEDYWVLWQEVEANGSIFIEPLHSHDIQLDVDCARCHFEINPWGLPLITGQEAKD